MLGAWHSVDVWLNSVNLQATEDRHCGIPLDEKGTLDENLHCRDDRRYSIQLKAGLNRLLLKVARPKRGNLGFYARIVGANGLVMDDVTYSQGPETNTPRLVNQTLPVAYRE